MKSECPTYLKSKGKAMAVTFSDGEVSDDESECDKDGLHGFNTWTWNIVSWSIKHIVDLPNYK